MGCRTAWIGWISSAWLAAACGNGGQSGEPVAEEDFTEVRSALSRELDPAVSADEIATLSAGNTEFALDLYGELVGEKPEAGQFFSPYSISVALAMTYAGAATTTAEAMASTLHFELDDEVLHPAFNAVDLALASRGEGAEGSDGEPFELHVVNSIWGQEGAAFLDPFLDTLAVNYGAGLRTLDFGQSDESREVINAWVADQTRDRIEDLLPPGSIDPSVLMVLVNAVYFNAAWAEKFQKEATAPGPFETLGGDEVEVPMMSQEAALGYYEAAGVQVVEKAYDGDELSMILLVPDEGTLADFEAGLSGEALQTILDGIVRSHGVLHMPKWRFDGETFSLKDALTALGMGEAFTGQADFSKLVEGGGPYIYDAYHQAFVAVDENGTEAAAATAVVVGESAPPTPEFELTIDRPFVYLIRDRATGTILFMGRMVDPS